MCCYHSIKSDHTYTCFLKAISKLFTNSNTNLMKYWNKWNHLASVRSQVVVPHHKHPTPWKDLIESNWYFQNIIDNKWKHCSTRSVEPRPPPPTRHNIYSRLSYEWINNIFNLVQIIAEQLGLEEKNQTQTFCFNVNFKKLLNLEVFQKKNELIC